LDSAVVFFFGLLQGAGMTFETPGPQPESSDRSGWLFRGEHPASIQIAVPGGSFLLSLYEQTQA
jgi:hypothetical protein